jgi:putative adhesin
MHRDFEVAGPVELDVRLASGEIEIDPTLEGRVEVDLTAHDEESQRLVDAARIELHERHGRSEIVVDVPQRKGFAFSLAFGKSGIACRIRCPHESSAAVRTKSADILARGTLGRLDVATASGDVEVQRVAGGINVKSASGDVSVREAGPANVATASGDVDIDIAHGPVNVATASGDVRIEEAYDDVSVNTVSGDQKHGAVIRGDVSLQSVSGDISVGVRRGSRVFLDCNTVSGDTSSELEPAAAPTAGDGPLVEIRAKAVSGDIRITRAPAPTETQEVHA